MRHLLVTSLIAVAIASPALAQTPPTHTGYFDSIDTDHDGTLSKSEWRAKSDATFKEIDTDHDGKISKDELKTYFAAKHKESDSREAAWKAEHAAAKTPPAKQ